jgi:hypothetical protein
VTTELREELAQSLDEAEWDWLIPHAKRDAIIVVSQGLDLLDVGVAIANNNVSLIQSWIDNQAIHKPSPSQLAYWNDHPSTRFNALIVQPFVAIQEFGG